MALNVKFLKGTAAGYTALATKDVNTFYYTDDNNLYLGTIKLSNGADLATAIGRVAQNEEDIEKLQEDLSALLGGEGAGSISEMIDAAVEEAKTALQQDITANTTAINEIKASIGEVPEGKTVLSIIEESEYDDTELSTAVAGKADKATTLAGYGITDAYTKTEADTAISTAVANASHLKREIVDALPEIEAANADTIYMVPKVNGAGEQQYDEYMLINGAFEKIGDSTVDLTNYATTENVATAKSEAIAAAATDATTKANTAETNAKAYADSLNTAMDTRMQAVETASEDAVKEVKSGTANGTIKVDGEDVAVTGLGTAAYANLDSFDAGGSAAAAEQNAKDYVDEALTWGSF